MRDVCWFQTGSQFRGGAVELRLPVPLNKEPRVQMCEGASPAAQQTPFVASLLAAAGATLNLELVMCGEEELSPPSMHWGRRAGGAGRGFLAEQRREEG